MATRFATSTDERRSVSGEKSGETLRSAETPSATGLRTEVVHDVHQGLSDQAIEAQIEGVYPGTLLIPTGGDGVAVFLIPALIIAVFGHLTHGAATRFYSMERYVPSTWHSSAGLGTTARAV